jgi:drug/metabolite transporter (DMT)-like permease
MVRDRDEFHSGAAQVNMGLLFCFLGMIAFGLLGACSKAAERRECNANTLTVTVFAWATLAMLARALVGGQGFALPAKAAVAAIACGICGAVAYYAFQTSIRMGKLSTAWLMMNLSAAVPALASVAMYGEPLSALKVVSLVLVAVAVLLLFRGHRGEHGAASGAGSPRLPVWIALMAVILVTNGMSAFGLKMIAAWKLPENLQPSYLALWYAAGMFSVAAPGLLRGARPRVREFGWGALLASLSMGGQVAMALALARGAPGHIVFPIAIGGSVLIVTLAGRFAFGERMSRATAGGVWLGLAAVVLLSVS